MYHATKRVGESRTIGATSIGVTTTPKAALSCLPSPSPTQVRLQWPWRCQLADYSGEIHPHDGCPGSWCSLVVCDTCGEMLTNPKPHGDRLIGICYQHGRRAHGVIVRREDCLMVADQSGRSIEGDVPSGITSPAPIERGPE